MRILSWNIQWGRGADGKVDVARTVEAIRAEPELDVICLQEVARNWPGLKGEAEARDLPAALAQAFPGYQPIFAPGVECGDGQGGTRGFGNLILTRLPIGQILRHPLPAPPDPGVRSMRRVCLEVVLADAGLRVLTTHLEYYSQAQRAAQVGALADLQAQVLAEADLPPVGKPGSVFGIPPRPAAAVLCGDLNMAPESDEYRQLTAGAGGEPLWRDCWPIMHGAQPHAHSVGLHGAEWPERPYCCDYFMVSPQLENRLAGVAVLADTAASDHQPLVLELEPLPGSGVG